MSSPPEPKKQINRSPQTSDVYKSKRIAGLKVFQIKLIPKTFQYNQTMRNTGIQPVTAPAISDLL